MKSEKKLSIPTAIRRQAGGVYRLIAIKSEPSNRLRNAVTDLSINKSEISCQKFHENGKLVPFSKHPCVANQIVLLPESGSLGYANIISTDLHFRSPSR